jgi:predicted nucleic acid-binding protein
MRGDPRLVTLVDAAEWIGVPAIVVGELWAGFLGGSRLEQNGAELDAVLANPVVEVLAADADVARGYGEIVTALRRAGTPVPTNDIWIAATAARWGATVLTYDAHFRLISRVGSLILE